MPESAPAERIEITDGAQIPGAFDRIRQAGGIPELVIEVRCGISGGVTSNAGLLAVRREGRVHARPISGVLLNMPILRELTRAVLMEGDVGGTLHVVAGEGRLTGERLPPRGTIELKTMELTLAELQAMNPPAPPKPDKPPARTKADAPQPQAPLREEEHGVECEIIEGEEPEEGVECEIIEGTEPLDLEPVKPKSASKAVRRIETILAAGHKPKIEVESKNSSEAIERRLKEDMGWTTTLLPPEKPSIKEKEVEDEDGEEEEGGTSKDRYSEGVRRTYNLDAIPPKGIKVENVPWNQLLEIFRLIFKLKEVKVTIGVGKRL